MMIHRCYFCTVFINTLIKTWHSGPVSVITADSMETILPSPPFLYGFAHFPSASIYVYALTRVCHMFQRKVQSSDPLSGH